MEARFYSFLEFFVFYKIEAVHGWFSPFEWCRARLAISWPPCWPLFAFQALYIEELFIFYLQNNTPYIALFRSSNGSQLKYACRNYSVLLYVFLQNVIHFLERPHRRVPLCRPSTPLQLLCNIIAEDFHFTNFWTFSHSKHWKYSIICPVILKFKSSSLSRLSPIRRRMEMLVESFLNFLLFSSVHLGILTSQVQTVCFFRFSSVLLNAVAM